jgi:hypothetical protein
MAGYLTILWNSGLTGRDHLPPFKGLEGNDRFTRILPLK